MSTGERAFGWVLDHLGDFRARPATASPVTRVKRLAELAGLSAALSPVLPSARALVALAWDELDEGQAIADLLAVQPAMACAYLPFRRAGLRSGEVERRLADPTWRQGYQRWALFARYAVGVTLESIGVAPPWNQASVLFASDVFLPPAGGTPLVNAALLAHVVMWATEMGRAPLTGGLRPAQTAAFLAIEPEWTRILIAAGQLDPLAELQLARGFLGAAPRDEVLALLARHQRSDGAVPPHPEAKGDDFALVYHATLVTALVTLMPKHTAAGLSEVHAACGHYAD